MGECKHILATGAIPSVITGLLQSVWIRDLSATYPVHVNLLRALPCLWRRSARPQLFAHSWCSPGCWALGVDGAVPSRLLCKREESHFCLAFTTHGGGPIPFMLRAEAFFMIASRPMSRTLSRVFCLQRRLAFLLHLLLLFCQLLVMSSGLMSVH